MACSNDISDPTNNYTSRLANVLDTEMAEIRPEFFKLHDFPKFPRVRELKLEHVESNLGVREFFSMKKCKLHSAIADKNSLLGKLSTPSQSLLIDLRILHHAPACVAQLKQDKQIALAEKLDKLIVSKKSQLPSLVWRAILGSAENRSFWSGAARPKDYPSSILNRSTEAIQKLTEFTSQVLNGNYVLSEVDEVQFEESLGLLQAGDGGVLLGEFTNLATGLETANQIVQQRIDRKLCLTPIPNSRAKHLQNVVSKFFIGQVQVHAVALTQRYRQLIEGYKGLEKQLLAAAPQNYATWASARQRLFNAGLNASKQHVAHIQKIYSQCGLQAG